MTTAIEIALKNGWDMFGGPKCKDFDRWEIGADCGGEYLELHYEPHGWRAYPLEQVIFNPDKEAVCFRCVTEPEGAPMYHKAKDTK